MRHPGCEIRDAGCGRRPGRQELGAVGWGVWVVTADRRLGQAEGRAAAAHVRPVPGGAVAAEDARAARGPRRPRERRAGGAGATRGVGRGGRVRRGGRASFFVWGGMGWGWFARLLSFPPFIWLVEWGYRVVANQRSFFARFTFRKE